MRPATDLLRLLNRAPRRQVSALFFLMLLSSATDGVGILLLVPLLEILRGGQANNPFAAELVSGLGMLGLPASAAGLLGAFILLVAIRCAVQFGRERLGARMQFQLVDRLRLQCFSALLAVEWRWLINARRSDHANLLLGDINRIGFGLNSGINLIATFCAIAAYIAVALLLSPLMTGLVLASGGFVMWLVAGQHRQALRLGTQQTLASRNLHANVQESLAGIKLSKVLGNEPRHLDLFARTMAELRRHQIAFGTSTSLSRALFQFVGALLLAAYLYLGLTIVLIPISELLTLVLIFSRLVPMFIASQQQLHQWTHAVPALHDTEQLMAECEAMAEPRGTGEHRPWTIEHGIKLDGVSLTYSGRDMPALDRVTLYFPARTTTAIIGASGSGKSTMADVVMGLLVPDSGAMSVDGVAIEGGLRQGWRHNVAYVPQDMFLFHDTIRNNLLWGNPEASDQDLHAALLRAAAGFVLKLPLGLDTPVGDGGLRLSGGERQRLALARALLKKPCLLILDEATSALDTKSEAEVRDAIEQLHGDLTVIIIGHRLPTLEHADQVVRLDAGRVVAQGSWAEVRAQSENLP